MNAPKPYNHPIQMILFTFVTMLVATNVAMARDLCRASL